MTRSYLIIMLATLVTGCEFHQDVGSTSDAGALPLPDARRDAGPVEAENMTVTGRLHDVETGQPLAAPDATGAVCDEQAPTVTGPCSVSLSVHDALAYVSDPAGSQPIDASIEVRDDGTFVAADFAPPPLGFAALVVTDAGAEDPWLPSMVSVDASPGTLSDVRVRVIRTSTDAAWTRSAGSPFGDQTFVEHGTLLVTFVDEDGAPVTGVQLQSGGSVLPEQDYYFDDVPGSHATVAPTRTSTGPNGSGLLVDVGLGAKSGSGQEPDGCQWPTVQAVAVPGTLMSARRPPFCP